MPKIAFTALLYLLEVTRSLQPESRVSKKHPRTYAPWSLQEQQLIKALEQHGFDQARAAVLVQRSPKALQERQKRNGETQIRLDDLPVSELSLTDADLDLLQKWTTEAPRDPLGWQYGEPALTRWLAPSPTPTLRVIDVEDGRPEQPVKYQDRPSPSLWARQEFDDAARSTWIDLAARLVYRKGEGQVLLPAPDPHHAGKLAIREAIRRVGSQVAPRLSVSTYPFPSDASDWGAPVVLIDRPERWSDSMITGLSDRTVLLVLPRLPFTAEAEGSGALETSTPSGPLKVELAMLPSLLQDTDDGDPFGYRAQEALIARWSTGRQTERQQQRGVPNSSGMSARLDWLSLHLLPPGGQVISTREDLLVRAAVWYSLAHGAEQLPALPADILERLHWVKACSDGLSLPERIPTLHRTSNRENHPALQRIMGRVWLDLLAMPSFASQGAASAAEGTPTVTFEIAVEAKPDMTYIGR